MSEDNGFSSSSSSNTEDENNSFEYYPFELEINYEGYDDLIAMNDDLLSLGDVYYADQSIGLFFLHYFFKY